MTIETQCCNLEQAKKLKELGVNQDAIWIWLYPAKEGIISTSSGLYYHLHAKDIFNDNEGNEFDSEMSAAYTASELIVMMPNDPRIGDWYMRYCWKGISFGYNGRNVGKDHIEEPWYKPEQAAEALAFLLIYLLENNLTTPSEVNERLK